MISDSPDSSRSGRFEVTFTLETSEDRIEGFRLRWSDFGESIAVVSENGTWSCHIHTDDIGAAIEAGIAAGTLSKIRVSDLVDLLDHEEVSEAVHSFQPVAGVMSAKLGVVAVVAGQGLVDVFRSLGAQGVVFGTQTSNPSTADILACVESIPAQRVVILPNNRNVVPVAEQIDTLTRKVVSVVPTRSVPQGVAAMFGYDPMSSNVASTVDDMAAAASSIMTGEVTRAVHDASVGFGHIRVGDWLGIADGTVVIADSDLEAALRGLVAAILPDGSELLTLYKGRGAPVSATKALLAWLGELHPDLAIVEVEGGQPLYPYLVSVE